MSGSNRGRSDWATHAILLLGVLIFAFPIYVALIASTLDSGTIGRGEMSLLPGSHLIQNYIAAWFSGGGRTTVASVQGMMLNSFVMAMVIAVGKIAISILSAYAVVFFRFPLRMPIFWMIFVTLMLPVEVRIVPTYGVVASLGMVNSYAGLVIPLIASATATFLFRQFFLSVPDELAEAARVDGASPMRFFFDILLPMSRTSIAALFVIQFIYGWNQYLWPLLITNQESYYTVVMTVSRQATVVDTVPSWNLIMAQAMLAMLPPVLVVVFMQRQFVRGLVETEK
ncbi:MAG: sn-glycerol-3-phosphate ABC transporter permease UgpE [Alphaproteobacteria bacterium]|nr:sn-glycerol-3-phosphate ABC transporter permease UgpE [Alphaproteobacteria bacterium]